MRGNIYQICYENATDKHSILRNQANVFAEVSVLHFEVNPIRIEYLIFKQSCEKCINAQRKEKIWDSIYNIRLISLDHVAYINSTNNLLYTGDILFVIQGESKK